MKCNRQRQSLAKRKETIGRARTNHQEKVKQEAKDAAKAAGFNSFIRNFHPRVQAKAIGERIEHPEWSLEKLMQYTFLIAEIDDLTHSHFAYGGDDNLPQVRKEEEV